MRNMQGYGQKGISLKWPNKAHLAINFVINYEEGAELTPLNGDCFAETYGGEFPLASKPKSVRNLSMESLFEYGSRAGIWRLLRLFDAHHIPLTFFITGLALTLNQELANYLRHSQHDMAGHGWRWIDYQSIEPKEEKKHIIQCVRSIEQLTGKQALGWYTGRQSGLTRELLKEVGGFLYLSDSYADDLPYFEERQLIIPYSLDCNDFRYSTNPGFNTADDFLVHLKNTFDYLYQEKRTGLMTIGLHPRLSGRPGRCIALAKFIDYIQKFSGVWITHRAEIANYWMKNF